jgi:hypothetical protein
MQLASSSTTPSSLGRPPYHAGIARIQFHDITPAITGVQRVTAALDHPWLGAAVDATVERLALDTDGLRA